MCHRVPVQFLLQLYFRWCHIYPPWFLFECICILEGILIQLVLFSYSYFSSNVTNVIYFPSTLVPSLPLAEELLSSLGIYAPTFFVNLNMISLVFLWPGADLMSTVLIFPEVAAFYRAYHWCSTILWCATILFVVNVVRFNGTCILALSKSILIW